MNVNDIKDDQIPTDFSVMDKLDWIFSRQHELASKYIPIEISNGLCFTHEMPVNIDDRYGQARLKDFFWRITEELTEAAEAKRIHPDNPTHTIEELADALHFMVEAALLAGFNSLDFAVTQPQMKDKLDQLMEESECYVIGLDTGCWAVTYFLGCASNCLKQRPWKQNHKLTDREKFDSLFHEAFRYLISVLRNEGLTSDEVFKIYFKKSEVNLFRQRSKY